MYAYVSVNTVNMSSNTVSSAKMLCISFTPCCVTVIKVNTGMLPFKKMFSLFSAIFCPILVCVLHCNPFLGCHLTVGLALSLCSATYNKKKFVESSGRCMYLLKTCEFK